jgi:hypothetical protein
MGGALREENESKRLPRDFLYSLPEGVKTRPTEEERRGLPPGAAPS